MKYTIYDSTSQEITGIIDTNDTNHIAHFDYLEGVYDGATNYIVDGEATTRPLLTSVISINDTTFVADGTSSIEITSLPECVVAIINLDEPDYPAFNEVIDDGDLELTTLIEGTYQIVINCFPYQQYIIEVEAT